MSYKEKKGRYKEDGLKSFLLYMGAIRIGFFCGGILLLFYYLYEINFSLHHFAWPVFYSDYLLWWPLLVLVGIFSAYIMWVIDIDTE